MNAETQRVHDYLTRQLVVLELFAKRYPELQWRISAYAFFASRDVDLFCRLFGWLANGREICHIELMFPTSSDVAEQRAILRLRDARDYFIRDIPVMDLV